MWHRSAMPGSDTGSDSDSGNSSVDVEVGVQVFATCSWRSRPQDVVTSSSSPSSSTSPITVPSTPNDLCNHVIDLVRRHLKSVHSCDDRADSSARISFSLVDPTSSPSLFPDVQDDDEDVEVMMTAPCHIPLVCGSVDDLSVHINDGDDGAGQSSTSPASLLKCLGIMSKSGMVFMSDAISPALLKDLHAAASLRISACDTLLKGRGIDADADDADFQFREIASRGAHRFDLLFASPKVVMLKPSMTSTTSPTLSPASSLPPLSAVEVLPRDLVLPSLHDEFTKAFASASPSDINHADLLGLITRFACHALWVPMVVEALQSRELVVTVSVVYSRPGAGEQYWHADGPHLFKHHRQNDGGNVPPPYALCVFLPLIPLDESVGFTQFWPRTHPPHCEPLIGFGAAAPLLGAAVDGIASSERSSIMYDYRLLHRGMPNKSEATQRPVMQFLYHLKTYTETRNYGQDYLWPEEVR
eukprot:TRINITY_DN2744_c0_g1_i1.p1 TRINITY_DN2744_c0_g1~~TRINITY_DN2744_c0_g1_i1.p1  ORF type:complete len:472 (+),score=89.34 TRINITY_DN2744_c0_g1_i1:335-1750(+)